MRVRGWHMDISVLEFFPVELLYNKNIRFDTCTLCLVSPCGQGKKKKVYFHMTEGCVGLQQEAWRHCFTISPETRSEHPALWCADRVFVFVMDASLPVVGTSTRRREGGYPDISGPLRPPGGVEVWRTSVLGMACVSVFSVCL